MAFIAKDVPLPQGFYGEITSTLYWCEEKFRWSQYIAEPVNTFTNLFFVYLSIRGAIDAKRAQLLDRFFWCQLGITLVGVGSFLFHATLKYSMQLLDELPMIYISTMLTYSVLETSRRGEKPRWGAALPLTLLALVVFITVAYVISNEPVFHQVAYASIQVASTAQVIMLLRAPTQSPAAAARIKEARTLYLTGGLIFLTAFGIWNLDNIFCAQLRDARNDLRAHGLWFLTPLLQGHGWWHIGTGLGAYQIAVSGSLLMMSIKEEPENFELARNGSIVPGFGSLVPSIRRVRPWKGQGKKQ